MYFCRIIVLLLLFLIATVVQNANCVFSQVPGLVEFTAGGRVHRGMPLVSLAHEMIVIGRDGWLHSIDPTQSEVAMKPLSGVYEPISTAELRNSLQAEYGGGYEVLATRHYLVVQPRGRGSRWSDLFEHSHRGFTDYMTKRGVNVRQGRFPMVAVVFPDQVAMYAEFRKLDINASRVAGVYSNSSNRVLTHDGGHSTLVAATVRHEAAHQSAFNSGVHSRVNDTPKWITEGIGQMFEPQAMFDTTLVSQRQARVNGISKAFIKKTFPGKNDHRFSQAVFDLVGSDAMFDDPQQVDKAYAVSWAMMFYLAERQPQQFAEILNHTAARPPFQTYQRKDRLVDFEAIIGVEAFEFSKRVQWFLESL